VPETTDAYEERRGMSPGAPVGMLDSGTPGEPEGYECVITMPQTAATVCQEVLEI
jgi:hypothetical protein